MPAKRETTGPVKRTKQGKATRTKPKEVSRIKRLSPRRTFASTFLAMIKAFFGSLIDPNYGPVHAKTKQSNVHGLYDNAPQGKVRTHMAQSEVPTSLSGG